MMKGAVVEWKCRECSQPAEVVPQVQMETADMAEESELTAEVSPEVQYTPRISPISLHTPCAVTRRQIMKISRYAAFA
ncbi:hypothetical protein DPMN_106130 [Dreissena polymorpha]|uniref:Uncharacterized protein n=1 Tax=Dreissena polymorpha TaxID=45954 RepID=A0A9D4K4K9_DREPO|nr:hypothetical protein DPMN_106130 [Dreissena polymorpha]